MDTVDQVYEILLAAWRPMTATQLLGAMREMFAVTGDPSWLCAQIDQSGRFTRDELGRYGLDVFTWPKPFGFQYIDPVQIVSADRADSEPVD